MTQVDALQARRAEFGACCGLFAAGVYATSFGPAMPMLARDFAVSLATAGLLLTTFFAGSIFASASVALWLHRLDPRRIAIVGLFAAALGFAVLGAAANWHAALAATLLTGFGDGLLVAGVHLVVARASVDVARGMNRLNLYFAIGAIVGPLWSGALLEFVVAGRLIAFTGVALLIAAAAVFLSMASSPLTTASARPVEGEHRTVPFNIAAWLMGGVLFLYVGAEFGLGSWVASYAASEFHAGLFTGGVVTAIYWGALMLGRLVSGWLFARGWNPQRVLFIAIAGALIASAAIAMADHVFLVAVAGAFATGFCLGPIWPAVLSIVAARSGGGAPASIVTLGNSGGVVFPWLQGGLMVWAGAAVGIAMTPVLCAAMLLLAFVAKGMMSRYVVPNAGGV